MALSEYIVNWSNVTDLGQLPAAANTATGGGFWSGMLFMIWIILFIVMIGWGWETALLTSAFISLMIALILVYADLVAWYILMIFVGIILFMFMYITWSGGRK